MSDFLFDDFTEVSAKEWKQKIQFDLKGADYNETLIWKTAEGIDIRPFYHQDDHIADLSISVPKKQYIGQKIFAGDASKANTKALDALERGAESFFFTIPDEKTDIDQLLKDIDLSEIPIHMETTFLSVDFTKRLDVYAETHKAQIHLHTDIIGNLARSGNWHTNMEEDHRILDAILKKGMHLKSVISVDLSLYQNAGAHSIQQLAYALAHVNEYLNHFNNQTSVLFNVAVGSNYFMEIAKIRALRLLWQTLSKEYSNNSDCYVIATPTKRNKTLYDYNVNMLRTTTECMSALLGGSDMVFNLPYDAIYHKDNEFGERISRNQLLILKNESYFDKVTNPVEGAYFLEDLTQQLAEKALALFKTIETGGGFLAQLKSNTIQRKIKESADAAQKRFDEGEEILLGTNKYPNPNDKMKGDLELYPFLKTDSRKTLIVPILERRLAESVEKSRLDEES